MSSQKKMWITVLIVSLLLIGLGAGLWAFTYFGVTDDDVLAGYHDHTVGTTVSHTSHQSVGVPTQVIRPIGSDPISGEEGENGRNPIDFDSLLETNTDIRGWLYIPDTNIDYPIMCSLEKSDSFYLEHNYLKQYEFDGSIYFEKQNAVDFSDRNTVMYGHNLLNGRMFRTLHYFEDKDFFDNHPYIYIYTPGHAYTYTVFAAYEYDDRHILNSFDFDNDQVWADYLAYVQNPQSMNVHTRDVEITTDDRIITLSTCVGTNKGARYLVQGVLTNDQPTA